ncbi:Formamidopyrimidine-DNA glycosylase N-terminal domain-containing protein [Haematococcus lacustris]
MRPQPRNRAPIACGFSPHLSAMPEGPELEAARRLVSMHVLGRRIVKVSAVEDTKTFVGKTAAEVVAALQGRVIHNACRKAKYLWLTLDRGPHPLFHFGMTGALCVEGVSAVQYKRASVDSSSCWPPKFCKLDLEFHDGVRMAFTDPRRFGKIQFLDNPSTQEPVSKLGFDVIAELPALPEFRARFGAYQKPGSVLRVKALLLDQGFTAGIGNWVADEVLYQARVHPEQLVADMPEAQVEAVHTAIREVCQTAVAANANSDLFPASWLFHARWTGKRASMCNGKPVEFVTVGSRTSAFVPALQRIITGTGLRAAS